MLKILLVIVYFSGWYGLFRWSRKNNNANMEILAWLMGGISGLMLIFGILNWELTILGYK
jgi:hypothetical protein